MAMTVKNLMISALSNFKLRANTLTSSLIYWITEAGEQHVTEVGERIFLD